MKRSLRLALLLLTALVAAPAAAQDLTADEIIDKALDQNGLGFHSGVVQMRLTVLDKDGKEDVKELLVKSKKGDNDNSKSQVTLLAPADAAGEAYLFLANKDREDEVYMFLPAFMETRKVSGTDKKGKFLGTHLTYRDLETRELQDGQATRLADEAIGPHDCYVIESIPKDLDDSDYAKVVTWVRKTDYMPLRVEFFDAKGNKVKRMFSDKISAKDGTKYVKKLSIFPEGEGSTTVEVLDIDFNAELPDKTFSKDALGQ